MLDNNRKLLLAMNDGNEIFMEAEMLNRHGLITGATGTGKTVSLQSMAESFSRLGIPVFMADVKGDLSGIAKAGVLRGKIAERVKEYGLEAKGWQTSGCPVRFWDVFGKNGVPVRATISDIGPVLLGRLLGLNEVQGAVLQMVFRIADDNGWLLLDLKDLRSMLNHVNAEKENYLDRYGQISSASVGAIQRSLLRLEDEGGELFFGEPALDIADLLQKEDGKGVINILDATTLINSAALYSCLLLWLLSELYERLPEAGDLKRPRLVFFFDEAHLLFNDISPVLLQKIEQIVRLIRSRGVGVFFVSQNPADIPDAILGQLGNRIQHALRAFTPKDRKAVRAAAQAFRPNPAFSTEEVIGELGVGEALVSFLDKNGSPSVVQRAFIMPPESQLGPVSPAERQELIMASDLGLKYDTSIDRESAYEILADRARQASLEREEEELRKQREKADAEWRKQCEKEDRELQKHLARSAKSPSRKSAAGSLDNLGPVPKKTKSPSKGGLDDLLGAALKQGARSAGSSVGKAVGQAILRGVLGGLLGKK